MHLHGFFSSFRLQGLGFKAVGYQNAEGHTNDENMKHGWNSTKDVGIGGGGGAQPPALFAHTMIRMTLPY